MGLIHLLLIVNAYFSQLSAMTNCFVFYPRTLFLSLLFPYCYWYDYPLIIKNRGGGIVGVLLSAMGRKSQIRLIHLEVIPIFSHYLWCYCRSLSIRKEGKVITKEGIWQIEFFNRRVVRDGISEVIGIRVQVYGTVYSINNFLSLNFFPGRGLYFFLLLLLLFFLSIYFRILSGGITLV